MPARGPANASPWTGKCKPVGWQMQDGMNKRILEHQLTQPTAQTIGNGHEEWLKFLTEYNPYHKDKTMTRERNNASGTVFLTNKAIYRKQNIRNAAWPALRMSKLYCLISR